MVVTHIPGKANAAADFLSRLRSHWNETIERKLTDRSPVRKIESCTRKGSDNTVEELFVDNLPVEILQKVDTNTLITLKQSANFLSSRASVQEFETKL